MGLVTMHVEIEEGIGYYHLGGLGHLPFEDSLAGTMSLDDHQYWWSRLTEDRDDQHEVLGAMWRCTISQTPAEFTPIRRTALAVYRFSLFHSYPADADPELVVYTHRVHDQFNWTSKPGVFPQYADIRAQTPDAAALGQVLRTSGILKTAYTQNDFRMEADALPWKLRGLHSSVPFEWATRVPAAAGRITAEPELANFWTAGWEPETVGELAQLFLDTVRAHEWRESLFAGMARASIVADLGPARAFAAATSSVPRAELAAAAAGTATMPDEYFNLLFPQAPKQEWDW